MSARHSDLFVAWQDVHGRSIYPVARLRVTEATEAKEPLYEFRYIRGAREAMKSGFVAFDSFPTLDETYLSRKLFPLFQNRIMPTNRPDYAGYVEELGLSVETADPIKLLARSGGLRSTDHIEIYAAPPCRVNLCDWYFLLRGIRHLPSSAEERIESLPQGARLSVMRDVQNEYNPNALLLRSDDDQKVNLGYIPDLLVDDLAKLDLARDKFKVTVARVNLRPAPIQHRVLCHLEVRWPEGRTPFTSDRFMPLKP
ncbi:MAG TPA: DNA-binding protein [Nannocystis exedens]|nr:DNA-binding protein [Nannocystis exedens]